MIGKIIIKPIITEKSMTDANKGVYTFVVNKKANKDNIRVAIESLFNVHVTGVKTNVVKGMRIRFTRLSKNMSDESYKKARVTLKKGEKIQVFEEVTEGGGK